MANVISVDFKATFDATEFDKGFGSVIASANNALVKIEQNNYDVLVVDIKLPDFTGTYLAEQVRKTKDTPIVFLTNYSTETVHEVANELNASLLTKKEALTTEGVLQDLIQKCVSV